MVQIRDPSDLGSLYIKGTGKSLLRVEPPILFMHIDTDQDHPIGTHPEKHTVGNTPGEHTRGTH